MITENNMPKESEAQEEFPPEKSWEELLLDLAKQLETEELEQGRRTTKRRKSRRGA